MSPKTEDLFSIKDGTDFERVALQVFKYQLENNPVYRNYIHALGIDTAGITSSAAIPFLPIGFFRTEKVVTASPAIEKVFESSGTTGQAAGKHYIADISVYETSFRNGFEHFYGKAGNYCFLALLPAYMERQGSSLLYMANDLVSRTKQNGSGFYLHNLDELIAKLEQAEATGQRSILLGVSYALLDLAEKKKLRLRHTTVMETGGMKGRRREMVREELHGILREACGVTEIHSEYGMTELLSQAYSKGEGIFRCPPWMKVLVRDTNDPLKLIGTGRTGAINVIDLANINSCPFIATEDLGKLHKDGAFEVLGRFDNSDLRGCNLLVDA